MHIVLGRWEDRAPCPTPKIFERVRISIGFFGGWVAMPSPPFHPTKSLETKRFQQFRWRGERGDGVPRPTFKNHRKHNDYHIFWGKWEVPVPLPNLQNNIMISIVFGEVGEDGHPCPTRRIIENVMISMVLEGGGK